MTVFSVDPDFEMNVGSGRTPGKADLRDGLA
jgi:hypothetical protein